MKSQSPQCWQYCSSTTTPLSGLGRNPGQRLERHIATSTNIPEQQTCCTFDSLAPDARPIRGISPSSVPQNPAQKTATDRRGLSNSIWARSQNDGDCIISHLTGGWRPLDCPQIHALGSSSSLASTGFSSYIVQTAPPISTSGDEQTSHLRSQFEHVLTGILVHWSCGSEDLSLGIGGWTHKGLSKFDACVLDPLVLLRPYPRFRKLVLRPHCYAVRQYVLLTFKPHLNLSCLISLILLITIY